MATKLLGQTYYIKILYEDPETLELRQGFVRHNPETNEVSVVNYAQEASTYVLAMSADSIAKQIRMPCRFSLSVECDVSYAYNDNLRIF